MRERVRERGKEGGKERERERERVMFTRSLELSFRASPLTFQTTVLSQMLNSFKDLCRRRYIV